MPTLRPESRLSSPAPSIGSRPITPRQDLLHSDTRQAILSGTTLAGAGDIPCLAPWSYCLCFHPHAGIETLAVWLAQAAAGQFFFSFSVFQFFSFFFLLVIAGPRGRRILGSDTTTSYWHEEWEKKKDRIEVGFLLMAHGRR